MNKNILAVIAGTYLLLFATNVIAQKQSSHTAFIRVKFEGDVHSVKAVDVYLTEKLIKRTVQDFRSTVSLHDSDFCDFLIPLKSDIGKIMMNIKYYKTYGGKDSLTLHDLLEDYVVKSGDSVIMKINIKDYQVTDIKVTGQGFAKYQCRSDNIFLLWKLREDKLRVVRATLSTGGHRNAANLDTLMEPLITYRQKMLNNLVEHKMQFSNKIYEIMRADVIGNVQWFWEAQLREDFIRGDISFRHTAKKWYENNYQAAAEFPDEILWYSRIYTEYRFEKIWTELFYKNNLVQYPPFTDLYRAIKKYTTGQLRERLLVLALTDPLKNFQVRGMRRDVASGFFTDALKAIKTKEFKEQIENATFYKVNPGSKPYQFNLPDPNGRLVSLKSFKGKLVLMDMWFTGCTGCAEFAEKLKTEIKPKLDNSKEIVFVSICTDENKNRWLQSIQLETYTEKDNVNLHLPAPNFSKNQMTKYYGLEGLPFIILIGRDGRIIRQISGGEKTEDIVKLISRTLSS